MAENPKPTGQPTMGFDNTPEPEERDWGRIRSEFERDAVIAIEKYKTAIEQAFQEKAKESLSSETAEEYLRGLTVTVENEDIRATVTGWLPTALDSGTDRFDMKPGLLAGRSSRIIRLRNGNFRTVSTKSSPQSWWHPGIQAKKISNQVKEEEPELYEESLGDFLAKYRKRVDV